MAYERVTDGRVQRHYRFFGSRGILALLVVNRETEKSYRPASTFLSSPLLAFSGFPRFHCTSTAEILPRCLAINPTWKTARETKRCAGPAIAASATVIATVRLIRRIGLLPFSMQSRRAHPAHGAFPYLVYRVAIHLRRN